MAYDKFVGKVIANIKRARKRAGLTQEDMEQFGFNIRHYQDIEGGKVRFTLETLYRMAKVFKISPERLIKS